MLCELGTRLGPTGTLQTSRHSKLAKKAAASLREYAKALENEGVRNLPLVESARPETRVDRYCDTGGGYRR
jgi:hypothetical protein